MDANRDPVEAFGLLLIVLAVLIGCLAVVDGLRGRRSWRDWWRDLR